MVNRSRCVPPESELDTIGVPGGARQVALRRSGGQATFADWSPDGRWLLYWAASQCSSSLAADGWPLKTVPAGGGGKPVTAVTHMLLFPDYLTWCGRRLIAAAGPSRETQRDSELVATGPPSWHQRTIGPASRLSWVSPACAPSGALLAAAAGPNTENAGFGVEHRSIWLLRPDGTVLRQLTSPPTRDLSDEAPRFSRDGRWLLFVRTHVVTVGRSAISRDTLELVPAAATGPATPVPLVAFSSNDFSYYDHFDWPSEIDWYLPATASAHTATGVAGRSAAAGRSMSARPPIAHVAVERRTNNSYTKATNRRSVWRTSGRPARYPRISQHRDVTLGCTCWGECGSRRLPDRGDRPVSASVDCGQEDSLGLLDAAGAGRGS